MSAEGGRKWVTVRVRGIEGRQCTQQPRMAGALGTRGQPAKKKGRRWCSSRKQLARTRFPFSQRDCLCHTRSTAAVSAVALRVPEIVASCSWPAHRTCAQLGYPFVQGGALKHSIMSAQHPSPGKKKEGRDDTNPQRVSRSEKTSLFLNFLPKKKR